MKLLGTLNPFWFGRYFRRFPLLGVFYHVAKALRFMGIVRGLD